MQARIDEAAFCRPASHDGIELMCAHWVRHAFPKHFHNCYTIGIGDGGAGGFDCRGRRFDVRRDILSLIEPGETHTGHARSSHGWIYRDLYIDADRLHALLADADVHALPRFRSAAVYDPDLARRFRAAFEALSVRRCSVLEQEHLLLKAVRLLFTRHSEAPENGGPALSPGRSSTRRVRDYLDAHYADEVTTGVLASLVSVSPYHLIRVFHREIGMPPHAYQNVVRVNRAQKLLRSEMNLPNVALVCGFYDQAHMNRIFHRVVGVTPGQYRSAISSKT